MARPAADHVPPPWPLRYLCVGACMGHVFEPAPSGRSRCRGCGGAIPRGQLRFGERLPNPFGEGEITMWFHPLCAACKRPEPLLETLGAAVPPEAAPGVASAADPAPFIPDRESLERTARGSLLFRRIPRIDGAEKAPSARARCRNCRQPIERGTWRIRLTFYDEGRFSPGGFVHLSCRKAYFETDDIVDRLLWLSPALSEADREDLRCACMAAAGPATPGGSS